MVKSSPAKEQPKRSALVTVSDYLGHKGLRSDSEAADIRLSSGSNKVEIPVPPFASMLVRQLLTPIPLFQFFCCVLWLLEDDYWKFMIFNVMSIIGFELSTVVQKRNNLNTLQSLGRRTLTDVWVRRGVWRTLSSDQLVPGDLISLETRGGGSIIPCDCVIVRGVGVVNEASLTGESVPQMKAALDPNSAAIDKASGLFSGTILLQVSEEGETTSKIAKSGNAPSPLEAVVTLTGSASSHGALLKMIENSQQKASTNKKETFILLGMLLVCALAASGYVIYERLSGTGNEKLMNMSWYKLMLRCVMILTSVVPPELPMQMALAVNTALLALQRGGVLCTDPGKVPCAGEVSVCLFDKTGTLTTDQLQCKGAWAGSSVSESAGNSPSELRNRKKGAPSSPKHESSEPVLLSPLIGPGVWVAAACHSLVSVEGKLVGDPVELAGLEISGAVYDPATQTASIRRSISPLITSSVLPAESLHIVHRFQFSSTLKRMSVVARLNGNEYLSLVKGSPEALFPQLRSPPNAYMDTYHELAGKGYRVLAFAYRTLASPNITRAEAEKNLEFSSLVAFGCPVRGDTKLVLGALKAGGLPSVMVTGDSALTAAHVAGEVGMAAKKFIVLDKIGEKLGWSDGSIFEEDLELAVSKKAEKHALALTGEALEMENGLYGLIRNFQVLARMDPKQKELAVQAYRKQGERPLMCGDGGNDIGALKSAEVGVALLGGFGGANTDRVIGDEESEDVEGVLEADSKIKALAEAETAKLFNAEMAEKRKAINANQPLWLAEELVQFGGSENAGFSGHIQAVKAVSQRINKALQEEAKLLREKHGVGSWGAPSAASTQSVAVSLGDASIAAPFTSRAPSIRAVLQIVRQGRCTLLVAVQQMQIMTLESLISAYTLAAVTMEGGRTTELQLIFSGVLVMVASIAFTYARPSNRLSSVRPINSIFHPAIFGSVIAQVLLHLMVMVYAMQLAKKAMGEKALSDLYAFEKARDDKISKIMDGEENPYATTFGVDYLSMFKAIPYKANLLNTVMFLVKTAQQVAVLLVNYKGRPWMQGATENQALFIASFLCAAGLFICSSGTVPELNKFLELMVLPVGLREQVLALLAVSTVGAFALDRFILFLFAKEIFHASTWEPLVNTRISDFFPILKSFAWVIGGVVALPYMLSNPLYAVGAWFLYKQWKNQQETANTELLKKAKEARLKPKDI